jgi:hypothetical protein
MSTHDVGSASAPAAMNLLRIDQGGQVDIDGASIALHRSIEDEHGPCAALTVQVADEAGPLRLTVRPGDPVDISGARQVLVVAVRPSTRDRRGAIDIAIAIA